MIKKRFNMECCVCKNKNAVIFSVEKVPCSHCGEDTEILYNMCDNCGAVWKSIGDEIVECITEKLSDEMKNLTDMFEDEVSSVRVIDLNPPKGTMCELVHKCLRCNTRSYEAGPGYYRCPDCGFEWEVI
jgi:hypothetical protein